MKIHHRNGYAIVPHPDYGFYQATPTPTQAELDDYYGARFYDQQKVDYFELQQKDKAWWDQVFDERLDILESLVSPRPRRMLDFGSGPGFFLKRAATRDWEVEGLEPSPKAAEFSRSQGIATHIGFLDQDFARLNAGRYHAVYSNGVLEHVRDPLAVLAACHELLAADGVLFLCVANDFNPIQNLLAEDLGFDPWWLCPPEHLNYFQPETLKALVEGHGFEIIDLTTTFPIDLFLLMGENYIGNATIGSACHGRRKALEAALIGNGHGDFKKALYRKFAELGIGREIELVARRRAV